MKTYAPFRTPGCFLRGNVHTHTTRSDGRLSLEETASTYRAKGYDFLAVTDHRVYYRGGDLGDMILLPGIESNADLLTPGRTKRTHHIVGIGHCAQGLIHDAPFTAEPVNGSQAMQKIIDTLVEQGNLCIYAHPHWSQTNIQDYGALENLFGFEVYNAGCDRNDDFGYAHNLWHDLLLQGHRLYAFATDDAHGPRDMGHGWISVYAKERSAGAILSAIKAGQFYASNGPEIHDITLEDGLLTVRCSPSRRIFFYTHRIAAAGKFLGYDGLLTTAQFKIPDGAPFVRVQCMDDAYHIAWSQPISLEDDAT